MPNQISPKYRLAALLLLLFLPGAHRIYVGKTRTGIYMLLGPFLMMLFIKIFSINNQTITVTEPKIILILSIVTIIWMCCIIVDLSKISLGSFKDINGLGLLRRKNHEISQKSNIIAILLCTFSGFLGTHRFYLKKTTSGLIILFSFLLMLLSSAIYFGFQGGANANLTSIFNKFMPIFKIIIKNYNWICIWELFVICFWVYTIDILALAGGVMLDADHKLPKDFSSN